MRDLMKEVRERANRYALEAMEILYSQLPFGEKFKFKDGTEGTIEKFFEPEVVDTKNGERAVRAGIDVKLADGGHLEFTIKMTGWGGTPSPGPGVLKS